MRPFHLLIHDANARAPRRVDFCAEGPDHAFQVARNECEGVHVELWDGEALLARMTKSAGGMWKLLPLASDPRSRERYGEEETAIMSEAGRV